MAQTPTLYCSRCRTTKPPLVSRRSYTCVMCGKSRNQEDFRTELEELRLTAPRPAPRAPDIAKKKPVAVEAPVVQRKPVVEKTPVVHEEPAVQEPPVVRDQPAVEAQPPSEPAAAPVPAAGVTICAWHECSNTARPRSKYCSRNCSNKNARWRHSKRDR